MTGIIVSDCPVCGKTIRVQVTFKDETRGFNDTIISCEWCGEPLLIQDSHKYNKKGEIVDEMSNV